MKQTMLSVLYGLYAFKILRGTTTSNKVLHDKTFNVVKNSKCNGY